MITLSILLAGSACSQTEKADMIITNGLIYGVDADFRTYEALAVRDGLVLELGSNKFITDKYKSKTVIDLNGKFVYPGFIDAHCHFYNYGMNLGNADLTGTHSYEDMLEIVNSHAEKTDSKWITGRGWDQNRWETKVFPDNKRLNELFPDRPVLLIRIDGHAALANSFALNLAGIENFSKVEGGDFLMDAKGELTGILIDKAIDLVRNLIPQPGENEIRQALLAAQDECFNAGLTSVHDAGLDKKIIRVIQELNDEGSLRMRIYAMLSPTEENLTTFMEKGIVKTPFLNIRSVKLYADGALGSRGARLTEPYSDDPDNCGLFLTTEEFIRNIAELAYQHGYQVGTHCIGDEANRLILRVYGDILKGKNDRRWRIEHAQVLHADDIARFSDYSVVPSVQTTHATSDMYWAEQRLGIERLKYAYAYKHLLEQNGWLPNGSDFPVESINPLYGFYAAISRKDHEGYPPVGFQMENALSREQALKAMTIWAAKAAFEENEKGSLEQGKFADFVVLDRDIISVAETEVLKTNVLMTVVGGIIEKNELDRDDL